MPRMDKENERKYTRVKKRLEGESEGQNTGEDVAEDCWTSCWVAGTCLSTVFEQAGFPFRESVRAEAGSSSVRAGEDGQLLQGA